MASQCRRGGTGRRTGLKILRDLYSRTGSIPVAGSNCKMSESLIFQGSLILIREIKNIKKLHKFI